MKIKKMALLIAALAAFDTSARKDPISIIHSFDSEIYTEAQPVKAFLDDFDKPLEQGDSAFTFNTFELGVKHMGVGVGVQSRFDYLLEFDPDTALFTHLEKNDLEFEKRNYRYYLKGQQSTNHGIYISYDVDLLDKTLQISPKVSFFQSAHFQDGVVEGTVFSDEVKGALNTNYHFSKDALFKEFTPAEKPQGKGYSFDLEINWAITDDLTVKFVGKDLAYEAEYEGSGRVTGFTTDIPFIENEQGQVISSPTVELTTSAFGREVSYTFERDARYMARVDYRISDRFSSSLTSRKFYSDVFHQLNVGYHFWDHWKAFGGYETHSEALEVGVSNKYFGLSFKTDNLNFDDANYVNLNWFIKKDF